MNDLMDKRYSGSSERIIAHLDMDAFFAAVEQRDNPALRGRPVVIGADPKGGKGRGVVATCSYEARPYGIHSAQPISVAYQKCPDAVFLRGNHAKYRSVSREIFRVLAEFTPDIEPVSIDEAFMDWTGCWRRYGSARRMAQEIKRRIQAETGLTASIGVAPVKFAAKIASDYDKPDGLCLIPPGRLNAFLRPLPVTKLWGVGARCQESLHRLKIFTIGDLAAFSRERLVAALGKRGAHLHDLANGIDPREVVMDDEVKSVSHEHTFEEDQSDPEVVCRILLRLSEKVSRRLRRQGLKGRTVSIKVRTTGFHTFTRAETLHRRVNLIDEIYPVARDLFTRFYKPGMAIRLIGVRVAQFDSPYVLDSLFEDTRTKRLEAVHAAMDRIKDKFGEEAIHRGV